MRFTQPMAYFGQYKTSSWAGYTFKEPLVPGNPAAGLHTGVDYNGPGAGNADLGMPVFAIADGIVRYVGNRTDINFGKTVIYEIPLSMKLKQDLSCDSLFARSMHHADYHVNVGQSIKAGEGIATVGNTGTTWAHNHLDLYKSTISYGGVHFNYDKNTRLESYLDSFEFIQAHLQDDEAVTPLLPYQRIVGASGVNHRESATTGSVIRREWAAGEVLDLKGYVKGESVGGIDIWFVGKHTGGYLWAGAFTDANPHDLPNLDEGSVVTPLPQPAMFVPDSALVTRVVPSPNFLTEEISPEYIVIHHWDDPEKDPSLQGVLNHLTDPAVGISAHYVIDDTGIYQLVLEKKRAQHAGPEGNNHFGIELDPNGGEAMYSHARALIVDMRRRTGKALPLKKHSDFMETSCPGAIDMARLETVTLPVPSPTTDPNSQLDRIERDTKASFAILDKVFKA